jgi:hypothetical protein
MDILTLGKIKKLKDALAASDLNTLEQIQIVNDALTQAIDVDVADALAQVALDLANTQAAVGGDLSGILTSMGTLETNTNIAIAAIPATVQTELNSLGTAGYLNVGTGANQVVQLDSSGNLPAIGAGNLTGLSQTESAKPWRIQSFSGQWIETMTQGQNTGYTSNGGSYTWSRGSGTTLIKVQVVGGGGGASGFCETGGSGGYAERWIENPPSTVSVNVGSGGGGSGYSSCAGGGGTSSFGSYLSANGGRGANCDGQHTGGRAGHGSGSADLKMFGGGGQGHEGGNPSSGLGGASYFGNGYGTGHGRVTGGWHHGAPGAGGNQHTYGSGYMGCTGAVIVYEYK